MVLSICLAALARLATWLPPLIARELVGEGADTRAPRWTINVVPSDSAPATTLRSQRPSRSPT
jgi:hypothetical protein